MELNPERKSSKVLIAVIVAAALVFSFVALAAPLSSFAADGNSTSTGSMVNSTNSMSTNSTKESVSTNVTVSPSAKVSTTGAQGERPQVWKGRIANLQMNGTQLAWIVTGAWALKAPAGAAINDNANMKFLANIGMVMPDGMAMHKHRVSDFKVSKASSNSTGTSISGTATVTMREGPVQGVPIKMNIMNNNAIAIWIGPDKVDNHFGSSPMYGTVFHLNQQGRTSATGSNATSTTSSSTSGSTSSSSSSNSTSTSSNSTSTSGNSSTAGSNSTGSSGSNSAGTNSTSSSTSPTSTSGTGSTIQMTAKDSVNLYSWFVGDQENPTLTLKANTPVTIMIQNPTETKHELVIESNGQEVASSGDVLSGSSGQLAYTPASAGTLQYHCEYHQDTMKGTIQVQ